MIIAFNKPSVRFLDLFGPLQADWYIEETKPKPSWPDEGKVALESYSTRYRQGLDLVLRGITASVNPGEKVSYM